MISSTRCRTAFGTVALALAIAFVAHGADDPATLTPAALKTAEATYKDAFGAGHDKAARSLKAADKSEFAKKLLDASAKATNDPALQEVLRKYALQFAQADAAGAAVASEVYKAYLAFPSKRAAASDKLGTLQEKTLAAEPPATKPKVAGEVIRWYRDAAAEYEREGNAGLAVASVGKARAVARKYTPAAKDVLAALDADERRVQSLSADQLETDRLKQAVEKAPDDVKARLALGCRYLRLNRTREAADLFRTGGDDWPAVAAALTEVPPTEPVAMSRLLVKAAGALPAEDKRSRYAVYDSARQLLEDMRQKSPERWPTLLPTYAALLDRTFGFEPAGQTAKLSAAIFFVQLDLAEAQIAKGAFPDAAFALGKARAAARTMKAADAKDFAGELDAMERGVKVRIALEADVEKMLASAALLDAKGQLALGIGLLRTGKPKEAAAALKASGVKPWQDVAALLTAAKPNPLELAHALRAAAAELKGEERTDVLSLARERYEAFLATNPPDIEKTRVELVAGELPVAFSQFGRDKPINLLTPANLKVLMDKGVGPGSIVDDNGSWVIDTQHRYVLGGNLAYKVVEKPSRPDEVRYAGFTWKSASNAGARVYIFTAAKHMGYFAGKPIEDSRLMQHAADPPRTPTVVLRDLFKDFGGGHTITGFGFGSVEAGPTQLGGFYLGKTPEQVRRGLARTVRE